MKKLALFGLLSLASAADGDDANVRYLMGDFKPSFGTQDISKWCTPGDKATFEKGTDGKISLKVAKWNGPCTFMTTPENGGLVGTGKIIADADPIMYKNIKNMEENVNNGDVKAVRMVKVNTDPKDTITRENTDKTAGTEKVVYTLTFTFQGDAAVVDGGSYTYVATFTREGPIQCLDADFKDTDSNCVATCPKDTFGDGASKKCVPKCPDGQFGNPTNSLCTKCDASCATCDSLEHCVSCVANKFLPISGTGLCGDTCAAGSFGDKNTWKCVDKCGDGRYANEQTTLCTDCNKACKTCTSDAICQSCNNGNYLPAAKEGGLCAPKCAENTFGNPEELKCITDCGAGKYGNTTTTLCTKCNDACATCTGDIICSKCNDGFFLPIPANGALCAAACGDRSYKVEADKVCKECGQNCLACTSDVECTTCDKRFGHPGTEKTCKACQDHEISENNACKPCDTNKFQKNNVCEDCGAHHIIESNNCKPCDNDKVAVKKDMTCVACAAGSIAKLDDTCETCKAGHISKNNKCEACGGKEYSSNNECKTCKTNEFVEANACKSCPAGCTECENGDKCTKCDDTHTKDGDKCKEKSSKLPYIIVGIIILVIIAVGVFYWFYRKKQADNLRASLVYKSANSYNE